MATVLDLVKLYDKAIQLTIQQGGHMAGAHRTFIEDLRAIKSLFQLGWMSEVIIRDWLRVLNFSDGNLMFGHKLANQDDVWEDEAELEFYECPTCHTACDVLGEILKLGEYDDPADEEGYELGEVAMDCCPLCGTKMELVILDSNDLPLEIPGDIKAMLLKKDGGPYATVAENAEFAEALRGGYPMIGAPEPYDTTDSRDPAKEGIWAEYLEPEGIWGFLELHLAEFANPWLNGEFELSEEAGEALWHLAIVAHKGGELNVVALAVLAERLDISEAEMAATPVNFVSDGNPGDNLLQFVLDHPELDDVELDLPRDDWSPRFANEEQSVADTAAHEFEQTLFAHWTEMAGQRKLVLDEETGRPLWAACWKPEDVAYAKAQFFAILGGLSATEARSRGNQARLRHIAKGRVVTKVTDAGIQLSSGARLSWVDAAQVAKLLKPAKGVVPQLRDMWVKLVDVRPSIAALGKALA
jgi:hypothetical protein